MVARDWVPDEGEVIWIRFDPPAGREQGGHRPAVVLTPARYNGLVGLLVCVPLTTRIKNYRFEVPSAGEQPSVALADHIKSFDWKARGARPAGQVSAIELATIKARVRRLIG